VTRGRDDAAAQVSQLTGQIKSLQAQVAAPAQTASAPAPDEPLFTLDQRREVQRALRLLGQYQGDADGGFGVGTQAAIRQFQQFDGVPDTGALSDDQRRTLVDMGQRLSLLLDQPPQSPQGVAASSIKGGDARYARAYIYEAGKGVRADPAEAAYWYALAASDGNAKAFTNLGTLVARGYGSVKPAPSDAVVLWGAAAARGESVAMYDLGLLYERGIGVTANLDLAKAWYRRAAGLNDPEAAKALKRLGA
jgi:TPR repeat protein